MLIEALPDRGTVLELASGTGQHITFFAAALPHLVYWQPSDPDPQARASIAARIQSASRHGNSCTASMNRAHTCWKNGRRSALDVTIITANLLHISGQPEVPYRP